MILESLCVLTLLLSVQICFFIFFELKHVQDRISKQSTRAYKYHAVIYNLGVLGHFVLKIRQEQLIKFIKLFELYQVFMHNLL